VTAALRVLIAGGTGFVGSALSVALQRRGVPADPIGSDVVDLTGEDAAGKLARLLDGEAALVLAARTRNAPDGPRRFVADAAMTATAAEAIGIARPAAVVFLSSFSVYGDERDLFAITEETRCSPSSYYGAARLAGEQILKVACTRSSSRLLVVRLSNVYGPGDTSNAYGPSRFATEIQEHGRLTLIGDGSEQRDYVFVYDAARAIADLLLAGASGTFNVCSGRSWSFAEIAAGFAGDSGELVEIVHKPSGGQRRGHQRAKPQKMLAALPGFTFETPGWTAPWYGVSNQ
jgi:UDP-glucose 4-epimerase